MTSCWPTIEPRRGDWIRHETSPDACRWRTCCGILVLALAAEAAPAPDCAAGWALRPSLTTAVEAWANTDVDAAPAHWSNVLLEPSLDYRPVGATASAQGWFVKARALLARDHGAGFEDSTGTFNPVSSIAASRHLRLANLHYWHAWDGGRVRAKIGQLAIDDDFMNSEVAAVLLQSAFGAIPSQVSTPLSHEAAYPVYPLAAPGLWFGANRGGGLSGQCGVYSGASGHDAASNHGVEWQHASTAGVVVFSEVSWQRDRTWPAIHLGGSYHSGAHDNYEALLRDPSASPVQALWNFYAFADLALTQHSDGSPQIGAFARAGVSPQHDRSTVTHYADAGLTWTGPVPRRPLDVVAFGVSSTRFPRAYRQLAGLRSSETIFELTYRVQCTARLAVQADVQRVHPASVGAPPHRYGPTTLLGARALAQF
jgi:porin